MDLCIYHGGCTDGVAAAWAVHRALGDKVEFYPGVYQKDPPWSVIHYAENVYVVDFSYKHEVMKELARRANGKVVVLDHHATARDELGPLLADRTIFGNFDMSRCGALMAWDWFHRPESRPPLMFYLDIYDRWAWDELTGCGPEDVHAIRFAVAAAPHDHSPKAFEAWDRLMDTPIPVLIERGKPVLNYQRRCIDDAKQRVRHVTVGEFKNVPCMNAPYFVASFAAGEMAEKATCGWAFCWWQNSDGTFTTSLRSRGGDPDVGEIAKRYGGGGHPGAAGFQTNEPVWTPFLRNGGVL